MSSIEAELMAASLQLRSDPAGAARRAVLMLERSPDHVQASLLLALAYRRMNDWPRALAALESLASRQPDSALTHLELGKAYAACGRPADALRTLERAVALDERLAEGWKELAAQYETAGRTVDGDRAYARFCALRPEPAELTDARVALAEGRLRASEVLLARRLQTAPDDVVARRMLAELASRRDNLAEAIRLLEECLRLAPGFMDARFELGRAFLAQQMPRETMPHADRLLAADPERLEYLVLKAQALRFTGADGEALTLMQRAGELHPDDPDAWLPYGHMLREVGESRRSIEMYRRALEVDPRRGDAYWSLANLKTFRFGAPDVEAMRRLAADPNLKARDRVPIEFALGKALEDAGLFEQSFSHYAKGNALHRASIVHDADAVSADVQRCRALHTREFFAERAGWGSDRRDPIFIVGLPRSGSTLLEQILAGHSQIEATMELADIPNMATELIAGHPSRRYPDALAALDRTRSEEYAARYLKNTRFRRTAGVPRFVDKMLANFAYVGLIQLMLPHASIIDIRRDPMASCFACFKQYFARGSDFTYDLAELGRYYRDYTLLMRHVDEALPGRVLHVRYEDLVQDPESQVRKVLDYCGLPFEEACLRFYERKGVVRTISSEQVRRPIYTDSLDRWRAFEPWLGPLERALTDAGS